MVGEGGGRGDEMSMTMEGVEESEKQRFTEHAGSGVHI